MQVLDRSAYPSVSRREVCSVTATRRVAAMLDLDPGSITEGDPLPRGWHFILMGADTRRSDLRSDGFPGLGVPLPNLGLPRVMLGGRTVEYRDYIPVGAQVQRTSAISSVTPKKGASGRLAIVTLEHKLGIVGSATSAIVETQTYLLMAGQARFNAPADEPQVVRATKTKTVTPDSTLLFQYSALGFNSHRIHIDRAYARDMEGFPDLVVNGGLATLLLTEFARVELALEIRSMKIKHLVPLFCGRPMTLAATQQGSLWRLSVHDDAGHLAASADVEL
jgi:3-methylfumaryl-CoA hydratase